MSTSLRNGRAQKPLAGQWRSIRWSYANEANAATARANSPGDDLLTPLGRAEWARAVSGRLESVGVPNALEM
jgi:hypothetical protein